jgi:hypothetical protein
MRSCRFAILLRLLGLALNAPVKPFGRLSGIPLKTTIVMEPVGDLGYPGGGETHDHGKTVKEGPARKQILRKFKNTSFFPSSFCLEKE